MIVYVGSFIFPYGDAVAKRVYGNAIVLESLGYNVRFIGYNSHVAINSISEDKKEEDFIYCEIHKPSNSFEHLIVYKDYLNIKERLFKWNEEERIDYIILTGTKCSFLANKITTLCRKSKIKVIADSMDWLEIKTGNYMFDFVKNIDLFLEINYVNRRADGIIAITKYLANHYKNKKTIVVPPLSPYKDKISKKTGKDQTIRIIYAGIPARIGKELKNTKYAKDRLDIAVDLLYSIKKKNISFIFDIYGLTTDQYLIIYPRHKLVIDELTKNNSIVFHGFVSDKIVRAAIENSDYSILIRESNRTTNAGFSTKLSESVALGTPIITTKTSDIDLYIKDGRDGFFVDLSDYCETEEILENVLKSGKKLSKKLKNSIKNNKSFEPKTYSNQIKAFLIDI